MGWLSRKSEGITFAEKTETDLFNSESLKEILLSLHRHLEPWRQELLQERKSNQANWDQGALPDYIASHPAHEAGWKVNAIPQDLLQRRVEITGPVNSAKMVINMLNPNSQGEVADMAMLDFEDSMCPTWENVVNGHLNVKHAVIGDLSYKSENGKVYKLHATEQAHVMIRVRGLHLNEEHVLIDNKPVSAGLFDLAVSAFHTAQAFLDKNQTPKYYVPKCESYKEAKWWNALLCKLEELLGLAPATLRCTFLIETLPAAFQMEEILYEVRERICGLNVGRWDKIFSDIKVLKNHPDRVLANRASIDMLRPWMDNYAHRLIKICHKRGAFAMGGMSAFTPGKDEATRQLQAQKVRADKQREYQLGHDGCWVSHPYFIGIAKEQFQSKNQLHVQLENFPLHPDLLPDAKGPKTIQGLRTNIRVAIAYQKGWNEGLGCISLDGLMEDLATLEISRAQVWQWLKHKVVLDDGVPVSPFVVSEVFEEECARLLNQELDVISDLSDYKKICADYLKAKDQAKQLFLEPELISFFTLYKPQGGQNAEITRGAHTLMEIQQPLAEY